MTKTYQQLVKQIETLKHQADQVRRKEVQGVVSRIKEAISAYGLTAEDLFGKGAKSRPAAQAKPSNAKAGGARARFQDEAGNTWSGRGPRPQWLKAALESGRARDDFAAGKRRATKGAAKPAKKFKVAAKYRDDAGNTWSGRGSRPRWLQAALDSGKTLEELAV